jgi:16S rRNA (uracil1498-N3)-methyltransferase
MTRRRWIADEFSDDRAALTGSHAEHLARVLRAKPGMEFDIAAGDRLRRGRVVSVRDDRVEFELGEELAAAAQQEVTVLLSVIKFDRFEWAVEKLTELGVKSVVPLLAARTDTHLAAASAKRVDRWRRIARESAEQSRRLTPPDVLDPVKLKNALDTPADCRLVLAESEEDETLAAAMRESKHGGSYALAVGPEGGWTPAEISQFATAEWKAVSLGSNILRAETAAIAATAVLQSKLA